MPVMILWWRTHRPSRLIAQISNLRLKSSDPKHQFRVSFAKTNDLRRSLTSNAAAFAVMRPTQPMNDVVVCHSSLPKQSQPL
jgi:hypothetical protein